MRRLLLILAVCAALMGAVSLSGCGGSGKKKGSKSGKKKGGKKKGGKKKPKKISDLPDPNIKEKLSLEQKEKIQRLGALSETHYAPAMEEIKNLGREAIPMLNYGLRYPLQNLRAKSLEILTSMTMEPAMIRGALNALKQSRSDVSIFETPMRRWGMKVLAAFPAYGIYTMPQARQAIEMDHDAAVRVLAGVALCNMGHSDGMAAIIPELRPIDWKVVEDLARVCNDASQDYDHRVSCKTKMDAFLKKNKLKPKSPVFLRTWREYKRSQEEARTLALKYIPLLGGPEETDYDALCTWWDGSKKSFKAKVVSMATDADPVTVEIMKWKAPEGVQLMSEELNNIDSDLEEAKEFIANGDIRRAVGLYLRAFKESRQTRMDIYYDYFDYRRRLGPDYAEKSYNDIRQKVLGWDPLNVKFRLLVAQCAKDFRGWKEAIDVYKIILILEPDNDEAKAGVTECEEAMK